MSQKKEKVVEVLVGRRNKCSDGTPMGNFKKPIETKDGWLVPFEWDYQFGVVINGTVIFASQPWTANKEYGDFCVLEAQEIQRILKKHDVKKFSIENGKRSRRSNDQIVDCDEIPPDELKIFKEALLHRKW
ncbi:MAG TPA: hypothetical protein VK158_06835 [Acidobacteriota bacterium]|nr:hypothetical protein [Acidobacteriota bacterium]